MPGGATVGPFGVVGEGGTLTKPQRELYIGNLPVGVTVPQLTEFLNAGEFLLCSCVIG